MPSLTEEPSDAIVFLDAELYVERVNAPVMVRQLQEQRRIPAALAVFVSHNGAAARHIDYICKPDYAAFIADDVVAWIRHNYPSVRDVVIAGLSLSGLAAAYIATRHPTTFRSAVCQSPSFWWENGRFAAELPAAQRQGQELWICVGDRETETGVSHPPSSLLQTSTQVEACEQTCVALRAKGYSIGFRRYDGGHDPNCWREDLSLALPWVWRRA